MADYFLSDVHIRLDRPGRGERLARLVRRLTPEDRLFVVGDLCDFWFASRQTRFDISRDAGLHALRDFRDRGGEAFALVGNHDSWLGPFYEERLGLQVLPDPSEMISHGLRLRLAHGHLVKRATAWWKDAMEGRAFLKAFGMLPNPIAGGLERLLEVANDRKRAESEARLLEAYREMVGSSPGRWDLALFGHVHQRIDEVHDSTRMIVLGDWFTASPHLRIDEDGPRRFEVPEVPASRPGAGPCELTDP